MLRFIRGALIGFVVALYGAHFGGLISNAATPGQLLMLLSGCPAQVQINGICPFAGFNFQTGTYYVQGVGSAPLTSFVSTSRASSKTCAYANGTLISVASNVLCVTDQGALIEEARTNKSTNYNANPPALVAMGTSAAFNAAATNAAAGGGDVNTLWGIVDDTASITTGGLANVANGRVFKIDNSAGAVAATIVITGATGNTNAHVVSSYTRGSGQIRVRASSYIPAYVSGSSTYSRTTPASFVPVNAAVQLIMDVNAGAVGYFILNQLEEGAFVTSPIVIAGSSATRAADVPQLIGPALTAALAAKSAFFQTIGVTYNSGAVNRLFAFDTAATAMSLTSNTGINISSGGNSASAALGSGDFTGLVKAAYGFGTSSMTAIANAGTRGSNANAWTAGTTPYLGNRSAGDRALNGYMQRFALSPVKSVFDGSTAP